MKRFAVSLAVVVAFGVFAAQANAQYGHHYRSWNGGANHQRHHDDLDHRAYHRDLDHREAHRYPMSWGQHGRLHDSLNHEAYHDRLEHRGAHRTGAYYPQYRSYYPRSYGYGSGFGVSGRNFSFWIGR